MSGYWLLFIVFMVLSMIVGGVLKRKFARYSKVPIENGMSGREVAEKMLRENGIYDVQVVSVAGQLTDHYNPLKKTVNLSKEVYHGRNVSAAAIAAHECGHAIQHAHQYAPLQMRSAMVPIQNLSARILNVIFIAMFIGVFAIQGLFSIQTALLVIIACYGIMTVFSLLTLPVEIDANKRALAWLDNAGITSYNTHPQAKDALQWAAYTYVVAALSALGSLLYFVAMFMGTRD
jgi:Zn-dependent membrane protease YugP